jgi:acyl-CoA hydrolase
VGVDVDLFDSGNLDFATATSIRFSPDGFKRFYDNWEQYAGKLLLRFSMREPMTQVLLAWA